MRYLMIAGPLFIFGSFVGWILRGWVTREKLRREIVRSNAANAPKETLDQLFKEL